MNGTTWGTVAAFVTPLVAAMSALTGLLIWFVRMQIRVAIAAMEIRLQMVEKAQGDMQKSQAETQKGLNDLAVTMGRIEGKISSGASMSTPSA